MSNIELKEEGVRVYVLGNTFPIKDAIKSAGGHWDGDRKAWWIGKKKKAELEAKINSASAPAQGQSSERKEPGEDATVAGRAEYKGKTYYMAGRVDRGRTQWDDRCEVITTRDGSKYLLYSRDGKMEFWAARELVKVVKTYSKPQTIRGLRQFALGLKEGKVESNPELRDAYRHGWDGKIGSPSYYSSGAFDGIDA